MKYENFLKWIERTSIYKNAKYKKAKSRVVAFSSLIPSDTELLLDFGCGNMYVDKLLSQSYPNLKIIGLDMVKHHDLDNSGFPNLTFQLYDGHWIPFPDDHFDCALAVAALHHTDDPEKYLRELVRVTKKSKNIIILEATYTTVFGWLFLQLNDRVRNFILKPELKGPLNFLSENQWNQLFHDLSLQLKEVKKVRPFSILVNQTLFRLSKP
jgi:ubiquinone/menaquinone biosynthesis C-methylase UbiE